MKNKTNWLELFIVIFFLPILLLLACFYLSTPYPFKGTILEIHQRTDNINRGQSEHKK